MATWEKRIAMGEAVKSFLVSVDGKVDLEASTAKYRSSCLQYIAKQESDTALVSECMTSLFDQFRGANLNLNFIKSQTVTLMGKKVPELKDPGLFSILSSKVEDYLHENCNQPAVAAKDDKPAVEAITDRTYDMRKGAGGGFFRCSDRPEAK